MFKKNYICKKNKKNYETNKKLFLVEVRLFKRGKAEKVVNDYFLFRVEVKVSREPLYNSSFVFCCFSL